MTDKTDNATATHCSRRLFSAGLLLAPFGGMLASTAQAAAPGQAAPDFSATDTNGKVHRLSDFKGRFVVLEWTNPGCPFVVKHYQGNMQALQKESIAKGAVWLAINSTETAASDYMAPAQLAGWMTDKKAAPTATLMDVSGQIGQLYAARTTPHMYIINPQGLLVYAGAIDSIPSTRVADIKTATNYVRQSLTEAMAGQPVSTAVSRAYGCSIKYAT